MSVFPESRYKVCFTFSQKEFNQQLNYDSYGKAVSPCIDLLYNLFSRHIFLHHPLKLTIPWLPKAHEERIEIGSCRHCLF